MGKHLRYVTMMITIAVCGMAPLRGAQARTEHMPAVAAAAHRHTEGSCVAGDGAALATMYAWAAPASSPAVTVIPAATNVTVLQSFAVKVKVGSEPGAPDPTGTVVLHAGGYNVSTALQAGGEATLTVPGGVLATGSNVLTAIYTPDAASAGYYGGGSGQAVVIVYPEPSYFSIAAPAITILRGAATGNTVRVAVQPYRGFTGLVTLTAAITGAPRLVHDLPTLSFGATSPVRIVGDSAGTAILTVTTTGNAGLASGNGPEIPLAPAAGSMLAGVLLLIWPANRKRWRQSGMQRALHVTAVAACSIWLLGCGIQGRFISSAGTTPGNYTVTVIGNSEGVSATGQFVVTVR